MRSRGRARSRPSPREKPIAHSALIEARGWGARYRGRTAWAVRSVDVRIEEGERVLLLGPSGGGKSTLLHAVAGLHGRTIPVETEGSLTVAGDAPRHGDAVGVVFQDPESQIVMARCGDEVAFGLEERCVPSAEIWPRVDEALAAVAFPYARDHPTAALSGGEKQRLALAAVLALRPRVLLLDEPTSNLDPDGARALYDILRGLPRSTTVLLVEHHLDLAREIVDRVIAIDGERGVVAEGGPGDLLAEAPFREAVSPRPSDAARAGDLVVARGVSFRYPGSERDALAPADAGLTPGEVLTLTGPNGSGKSTLLLLLGGLMRPQRGSVRADALDPARPEPWRWPAREVAARLGSVFQDPDHQFLATTVRDELALGPRIAGDPAAGARADELMQRLRLAHLADANPFTLSGGEKRRLSVGAILACAPRALLLDEPTYGLDPTTFRELIDLIDDARSAGAAIGIATHERALRDALGGRVVTLRRAA